MVSFIISLAALVLAVVCSTFLLLSPMALALSEPVAYTGSVIILVVALVWFFAWYKQNMKINNSNT